MVSTRYKLRVAGYLRDDADRVSTLRSASPTSQAALFLMSGGLATLIHWAVMACLIWMGYRPVSATIAGAFAGSIANYLLQFYWTFKRNSGHGTAIYAYACTVILGWCLNAALFHFLASFAHARLNVAQVCATLAVAVMNFIFYKKVVFHERISRKLAP